MFTGRMHFGGSILPAHCAVRMNSLHRPLAIFMLVFYKVAATAEIKLILQLTLPRRGFISKQ
jgi:hypothetical protein